MRFLAPLVVALSVGCAQTPYLIRTDSARLRADIDKENKRGPVLVNFWATWCEPCVKELPALLTLRKKRALTLVLVSADFPSVFGDVERTLKELGVDFPSYLKDEGDDAFINGFDKRWTGALPATFLYDARGALQWFHEGEVTAEQIERLLDGGEAQ